MATNFGKRNKQAKTDAQKYKQVKLNKVDYSEYYISILIRVRPYPSQFLENSQQLSRGEALRWKKLGFAGCQQNMVIQRRKKDCW